MSSEQFLRISRLIGDQKIEQLNKKRVAIIGLGAVGGMCLESLTRSGVGSFTLVDFDTISITNINRQILATWDTVGERKVTEAKKRVQSINPNCKVNAIPYFFDETTVDTIFSEKFDLVIDCIDSLNPKCCLLEYCWKNNIKVISCMGAALKRNPLLVRNSDLFDTYGCHLAKLLRKRLRNRGVDRGISVIFSPEVIRYEFKEPESEDLPEFNEQILSKGRERNVLGSLPTITGIFGLHLAHLALSSLVGEDEFNGQEAINANNKFKKKS